MELTDYLENRMARHAVGLSDYASPYSDLHLALFDNAQQGDLENGYFYDEIDSGTTNYSREPISSFQNAGTGLADNPNQIQLPTATSDWGTVTAIGLTDGSGNLLCYDQDVTDKPVEANDTYRIEATDLVIDTRAGDASDWLENALVDHWFVDGSFTAPSTVEMALCTASGNLEGNSLADEIDSNTYTQYSRQTASWQDVAGTDGQVQISGDIQWAQAQQQWPSVDAIAAVDGFGTVLCYDPSPTSKTIYTGDYYILRDGNFDFTLD